MTDARLATTALAALTAPATTDARVATTALAALTAPATTDARVATVALAVLVLSHEPPAHQGWGIPA